MRIGPFGAWEILIILIVVLLIFGPRRLPEMAKGLGQSVRVFRTELRGRRGHVDDADSGRPDRAGADQPSRAAPGRPVHDAQPMDSSEVPADPPTA